jgi:hypothetical protein
MKRLAIAFITLLLLAHGAHAQILPDAPATPPDPSWNRLRTLAIGQPLMITTTDNRSVHCLFGSVTESYLFCNPPGNPEGVGFRFDRIDVLSVDFDRTGTSLPQAHRTERNDHPAWISSMIAGGLVVGIIASQNTDARKAAQDGLIGAPLAFLPHPDDPPPHPPVFRPYGLGIRLSPNLIRHHSTVHLR